MKTPNIILVDDHLIFRQGLKALISYEKLGTVIGEASNGNEFIEKLPSLKPDLVIMDIDMPEMNGIDAAKKALEMVPNLKIIVFSMYGDNEYYIKMLDIGVKGFIIKSSGIVELENAIRGVMNGHNYYSTDLPKNTENKFGQKKIVDLKSETPIPWW